MNLQQLRCIVEIARVGSITKAAENLYMNQPNLSRTVIDFENEYGITLFIRNSQGVEVTETGAKVVAEAEKIINQTNSFNHFLLNNNKNKLIFKVSVPRASYISYSFCKTIKEKKNEKFLDVSFKESNNTDIVHDVVFNGYNYGIIRIPVEVEDKFKKMLSRKGVAFEEIWHFKYNVVLSKSHPLANKEKIYLDDLEEYSVLRHNDEYVPFISKKEMNQHSLSYKSKSKIVIQERGSQFDILSNLSNTYMWVSPIPKALLEKHQLIMKSCEDNEQVFIDMLIYSKNHEKSEFEDAFINDLKNTINILKENS